MANIDSGRRGFMGIGAWFDIGVFRLEFLWGRGNCDHRLKVGILSLTNYSFEDDGIGSGDFVNTAPSGWVRIVPAGRTVGVIGESFGNADTDGLVNFTFRLDVGNNGSYEINQAFTGVNKANFNTSGNTTWIEFDLSAENISLAAGTTHSVWWNSNQAAGQWVCAPKYNNASISGGVANAYNDGSILGAAAGSGTRDALFAVTTVPEPAAGLLAGLGLFGLLRRRRA